MASLIDLAKRRHEQREATRRADYDITTERRLDGDRELEVVVMRHKRGKRRGQHVGCSIEFFRHAFRATMGDHMALALALLIYRRCIVSKGSKTVKLDGAELAYVGITRRRKSEALLRLQKAGLIRLQSNGKGRSATITLLWPQ